MMRILFNLFLILVMTSCQSQVDFHAGATKNINPDIVKKTFNPVSIMVYQMKENAKFEEVDFFQLIDSPESALGSDFLPPLTAFMISPNEKKEIQIDLRKDAKFIGVVAAFQSIEGSQWKKIIALEGESKSNIYVKVKGREIFVGKEEDHGQ
jgi:type VI secretion system protein VasD